jgi:small membrane protein
MTAFQYIVVGLSLLACWATLRSAMRGGIRKRIAGFWLLVWITVATTMIWPEATAFVARRLGIGRGADLVMYVSVLTMLVGFFYVYTRFRRLDRTITLLVRRLAVDNPVLPSRNQPPSVSEPPAAS